MAEDAVDAAIKSGKLKADECKTHNLILTGGYGWDPANFTVIAQQYVRTKKTSDGRTVPGVMDTAVAKHLSQAYGTLAERVASISQVKALITMSLSCYVANETEILSFTWYMIFFLLYSLIF